jgi:hypothetical protein
MSCLVVACLVLSSPRTDLIYRAPFFVLFHDKVDLGDMFRFDTDTWQWHSMPLFAGYDTLGRIQAVPTPRRHHTVTYVPKDCCGDPNEKGSLWLIGGNGPNIMTGSESALSDLFVLDLDTNLWCKKTTVGIDLPALSHHTTTLIGHKLFIIGGCCSSYGKREQDVSDAANLIRDGSGGATTASILVLDMDTMKLAPVAVSGPTPGRRYGHKTQVHPGAPSTILMFGGRIATATSLRLQEEVHRDSSIFLFDTLTLSWSIMPGPAPAPTEEMWQPPSPTTHQNCMQRGSTCSNFWEKPALSPPASRCHHVFEVMTTLEDENGFAVQNPSRDAGIGWRKETKSAILFGGIPSSMLTPSGSCEGILHRLILSTRIYRARPSGQHLEDTKRKVKVVKAPSRIRTFQKTEIHESSKKLPSAACGKCEIYTIAGVKEKALSLSRQQSHQRPLTLLGSESGAEKTRGDVMHFSSAHNSESGGSTSRSFAANPIASKHESFDLNFSTGEDEIARDEHLLFNHKDEPMRREWGNVGPRTVLAVATFSQSTQSSNAAGEGLKVPTSYAEFKQQHGAIFTTRTSNHAQRLKILKQELLENRCSTFKEKVPFTFQTSPITRPRTSPAPFFSENDRDPQTAGRPKTSCSQTPHMQPRFLGKSPPLF